MEPTLSGFNVVGIPAEFILFAVTLGGVALFHHRTLQIALVGLAAIAVYRFAFTGFVEGAGVAGLGAHLAHEWVVLANLGLLLLGFALLARHFEQSSLPDLAPDFLPNGWLGGLTLLALVFVLSGFLDNIAAALIGATVARHIYQGKVQIAFLAAIVAASNAGGAGSVVGDTTTTMMWIDGKSPLDVVHGYVGAIAAFAVLSVPAALAQEKFQPMLRDDLGGFRVDWRRLVIVGIILLAAVGTNIVVNETAPHLSDQLPVLGLAVWIAILATAPLRRPDWRVLPEAGKGALFLLALVLCASFMPVEALPAASWHSAFGIGLISSVFDNIPLTTLALAQGGYDWGVLAYAVGFGGSLLWFGSSAGVAVSNLFPDARSAVAWVRGAWWLIPAYVVGFAALLLILGWRPEL
jgi:Na+/H+ antiporter NhaD/arsenite permease-like protein